MVSTSFDEDKHFLMQLILNADLNITEGCKEVAGKLGSDVKPERLR